VPSPAQVSIFLSCTFVLIPIFTFCPQSQQSPRQDGSDHAESDFIYESCCSVATKQYQMGRQVISEMLFTMHHVCGQVSPEAVPLTVAELARTTYAIPTTVQELVNSDVRSVSCALHFQSQSLPSSSFCPEQLLLSPSSEQPSRSSTLALTVCTGGPGPVVTTLPPLPRSLPPSGPRRSGFFSLTFYASST
jgi:hypothetical protein